jgi:hypothetical protein
MNRIISIGWSIVLLILMIASAPTLDYFLNSPDMGYQLSLGSIMLSGKFPFVDMLQHYGPLVTFTSAAGQWMHGSVVPEVLICSLGYCVAITCIYYVIARGGNARMRWTMLAGLVSSFSAWCVLPQFYKWYYWCFPMLTLACCSHFLENSSKWRIWRFAAGLIASTGFLYRHDLGVVCLLTVIVVIAAQNHLAPKGRNLMNELAWVAGGFLLPLASWFSILVVVGGPISCWWYISALWDGTSGVTEHWRQPLPYWDWRNPASNNSCRFQLLALMGLSYACAIILNAKVLLRERQHVSSDAALLLGTGALGLAIIPQGLYRPDTQHILQVSTPILIVAPLFILRMLNLPRERAMTRKRALRTSFALAYVALLVFPFACLRTDYCGNLAPLGQDVINRYRALAAGLDVADPDNSVAAAARLVQHLTSPDQAILVTPLRPQLYFWAKRPMSGLLNGYAGIFSKDIWRRRNFSAVQKAPPALIVADVYFVLGDPNELLQKYNPELYDWLKERYPLVVAKSGNFVMLAPHAGKSVRMSGDDLSIVETLPIGDRR